YLLDEGERAGIAWSDYRMHALLGGEGMAEELRDYLLLQFRSVFSGYGATDIEIGMAGESPASVALRRVARADPELHRALFGESRLPMVFQYNPLIHHLEMNREGEVLCTISRLDVLAPRIRYNVHDEGGILDYGAVEQILRRRGLHLDTLHEHPGAAGPRGPLPWTRPVHLPFLWIFGRRDATISVMGANIYPEDIETLIYRDPPLARRIHSFGLLTISGEDGTTRPGVALELSEGVSVDQSWSERIARQLSSGLAGLNLDYRTAAREFPGAMGLLVSVYPLGTGPFAADVGRIKQRRIFQG
ncbi:MAG TPA: phenylacetate--CoA ligase family protein, partial [Chloroflexota bacterium]|nr:phenylacetate--CoA ligase family protein [Chloroflexota bacterium]